MQTQSEIKELFSTAVVSREYTFGMNDADLFCTNKGFFVQDNALSQVFVYDTYSEASGKAKMIAADAGRKNKRFAFGRI